MQPAAFYLLSFHYDLFAVARWMLTAEVVLLGLFVVSHEGGLSNDPR